MSGIILLGTLTGCSGKKSFVKNGEIKQTIVQESEQKRYFETIGIGAADSTLKNTTQRRATSRDAAIVQAQYEMLSIVKGVQLEGGITVQKAMETDSNIETNLKEMIKGAEIIKSEWTNDDGCVVTLRLDKRKLETSANLKVKS
ncbi:MAG: hypothetical protein WC859_05625 [Elusimicrobiota bacterium]|jgi:hypothetical protein